MRVVLVNNFFPPRVAGSAHFTEALAHELGSMGHAVLVVTAAHNAPEGVEERRTFSIQRLPSWSPPRTRLAYGYDLAFCLSPPVIGTVRRVLDGFAPDVVHEHNQVFDLSLMASAWARRRTIPVVLTIHTALIHTERVPSVALLALDRVVARSFIKLSHAHVVTPDVFMRDYVARRYGLAPPSRVSTIPIGIDTTPFEAGNGQRARAALGIGDRPMILSLGHVMPLRNRLGLVEALPLVMRRIPGLAVVVAGEVYDRRFLQRAVQLGVRDALIVLGTVPRPQVHDLVAAADVGCHELSGIGFGTASLELMGAGVASAAVVREDNFPGVKLRNWQDVVMVPPDEPMSLAEVLVTLLEDPELRKRIGTAGRQLVSEHFTIRRVSERYVALYQRLIATSPPAPPPALRALAAGCGVRRRRRLHRE
jgi:glycosyltransferase involved in cell wall biosynthesis